MQRLDIMIKSSDAYSFMAGAAVESLLFNASTVIDYRIYIVTTDMSDDNKKKILSYNYKYNRVTHIIFIVDATECDEYLRNNHVEKFRDSYAPYYCLMADYLLKDYNPQKILVLDADSIVVGNLEGLISFNFNNKPLALTWQEKMVVHNIPKHYRYCRSSLVYIDVRKWNLANCRDRALKLLKWCNKQGYYTTQEEGILNFEFQNEIEILPLKYNLYDITIPFSFKAKKLFYRTEHLTNEELIEACNRPEIIHFGRSFLYRPNEEGSRDKMSELWWHYCRMTPWREMQPTKPLPLNGNEKIFRRIYLILPDTVANYIYIFSRKILNWLHKETDFERKYSEWKETEKIDENDGD